MQYVVQPCWLGWVLVAATVKGICAIALGDTAESLSTQLQIDFPHASLRLGNTVFQTWVEQVLASIETPQTNLGLPLHIWGTAFQQQVWQTLQSIPVGTTLSYAEVAQHLGNPRAVCAVAQACANNKLAVAIPCHRVVGSDGSLRGYRWGRDRTFCQVEVIAPLTVRQWPPTFASLIRIILGKQLSTKAVQAIFARLTQLLELTPANLAAAPEATLKQAGLSRAKITTCQRLSTAILDGYLSAANLLNNCPPSSTATVNGYFCSNTR